jgi:uncharacterized membrane protein
MGGAMMGCPGCPITALIWLLVATGLIALLVAALIWLVRHTTSRGMANGPAGEGRGAINELELRYARGEIDRETFLTMRSDLGSDERRDRMGWGKLGSRLPNGDG